MDETSSNWSVLNSHNHNHHIWWIFWKIFLSHTRIKFFVLSGENKFIKGFVFWTPETGSLATCALGWAILGKLKTVNTMVIFIQNHSKRWHPKLWLVDIGSNPIVFLVECTEKGKALKVVCEINFQSLGGLGKHRVAIVAHGTHTFTLIHNYTPQQGKLFARPKRRKLFVARNWSGFLCRDNIPDTQEELVSGCHNNNSGYRHHLLNW